MELLELFLSRLERRVFLLFGGDTTSCDGGLELCESLLSGYGGVEMKSFNIIESLYDVQSCVLAIIVPLVTLLKEKSVDLRLLHHFPLVLLDVSAVEAFGL